MKKKFRIRLLPLFFISSIIFMECLWLFGFVPGNKENLQLYIWGHVIFIAGTTLFYFIFKQEEKIEMENWREEENAKYKRWCKSEGIPEEDFFKKAETIKRRFEQ